MSVNTQPVRSKPLPRTRRQKYDGSIRFSKLPPKENRAKQISRKNDTIKNISIGLQDHDEMMLYFFNEVIKPKVIENGALINVPIKYGDPEMWSAVQKQGHVLDRKGNIIAPIIMYRRTNVSQNSDIPIDKADRNIIHYFPKKYSNEKNKYDRFSLINNLKPTYEMYNVVVPDYVNITYECVIWTSFISQMNRIVEDLQYWEGSYWGDDKKFKFKTNIDSFDQNVEMDKGRVVRSNFTLNIKGFLIPEVANDLITTQKEYTTQQIILNTETEVTLDKKFKPKPTYLRTGAPVVSSGTTTTSTSIDVTTQIILFLNNDKYKKSNTITPDDGNGRSVAYFNSTEKADVPSGLNPLTVNDYLFFCNGQYMEHDALSIDQTGTTFILYANISSLGYSLDANDEILAWGKFK